MLKLKQMIKELAKNAVFVAEEQLGSGNGQRKKQLAIEYIVKNLPFSVPIKNLISFFLSKFIDNAVEFAVQYMNSLKQEQGE